MRRQNDDGRTDPSRFARPAAMPAFDDGATLDASRRDDGGPALFKPRSSDEQDKWICERLRELYATGSFWHVSAKLAADRIEHLIAERDCALAAFELELDRAGTAGPIDAPETPAPPVSEPLATEAEPLEGEVLLRDPLPAAPQNDGAPQRERALLPAVLDAPRLRADPTPRSGAMVEIDLSPVWALDVTDDEIEAAARIMCAHSGVDPDEPIFYREHKGVRVRSERPEEDPSRFSTMPVWKWRFADQARAALEAAAGVRSQASAAGPQAGASASAAVAPDLSAEETVLGGG